MTRMLFGSQAIHQKGPLQVGGVDTLDLMDEESSSLVCVAGRPHQPVEKVTFYENRPPRLAKGLAPISASQILDDIPVSPPFRSLTWTKIARFSLRSTSSTGCSYATDAFFNVKVPPPREGNLLRRDVL